MTRHEDDASGVELSAADQRLLDALVEHDFDLDRLQCSSERERARAERLVDLLGLMDAYPVHDADEPLMREALQRIDRWREASAETTRGLTLSPDDARVLDALADAGYELDRIERPTAGDRERVEVIDALLSTMHEYPVDDASETLLHATMARIDRYEAERTQRMTLAPTVATRRRQPRGFRLPDLVRFAAVLLIGAAISLPLLNRTSDADRDGQRVRQAGWDAGSIFDSSDTATADLTTPFEAVFRYLNNPGDATATDPSEVRPVDDSAGSGSWSMMMWFRTRIPVITDDNGHVLPPTAFGPIGGPIPMVIDSNGTGRIFYRHDESVLWLGYPVIHDGDRLRLPPELRLIYPAPVNAP